MTILYCGTMTYEGLRYKSEIYLKAGKTSGSRGFRMGKKMIGKILRTMPRGKSRKGYLREYIL